VRVGARLDGLGHHLEELGLKAEASVARSIRTDLAAIRDRLPERRIPDVRTTNVVHLDERARWLP
jgi:hypothetical protein